MNDPYSFNSRHALTISESPTAFYRSKGSMEVYLEAAHGYRDFLVWQPAHPRGYTKGNNPSNFKPKNDFYDVGEEMVNTERISTSRLMVNRSINGRVTASGSGSRKSVADDEPVVLERVVDPGVSRIRLSPRSALRAESTKTMDDINSFEASHHNIVEMENMTKQELIDLIVKRGFEIPGEVTFDTVSNTYKKARLKKAKYLEFLRQNLYGNTSLPVVQRGHKIGSTFCVVSIYKSLHGSVRIIAYDTDRSLSYNLYLTEFRLEDLDIRKIPEKKEVIDDPFAFRDFTKTDAEIKKEKEDLQAEYDLEYNANWQDWGGIVIERLILSPQGDLEVGPAKLMSNGLSKHFCLTGRDAASEEEARSKSPSRVHVTSWFTKM
jgi:hypothetical protein